MAFQGFQASVDNDVREALDESKSSGPIAPLPKGRYQVEVVPLDKNKNLLVEAVEFSKKPEYAGKMALCVALKVIAESPTGANRYFFERVPMFSRYLPSQKNPKGAPARAYFGFFGAVGVSEADIIAGNLPGAEFYIGKRLTVTLGDPIKPDQYNPLGSNEVAFYDPAGDPSTTPRIIPGQRIAPWLTDDNRDIDPAYAEQQAATAQAADWRNPGGFSAAPAQAAPAAPAQQWATGGNAAPAAQTAPPAMGWAPSVAPVAAPAQAEPGVQQAWLASDAEAQQVLQQQNPALAGAVANGGQGF